MSSNRQTERGENITSFTFDDGGNKRKILNVVENNFFEKFTAIDAASFTPPYLTLHWFFMPIKTLFPVWNDFQFCFIARHANR